VGSTRQEGPGEVKTEYLFGEGKKKFNTLANQMHSAVSQIPTQKERGKTLTGFSTITLADSGEISWALPLAVK